MAFSGPPEDRILIRELINGYSDAVFRQDEVAYLACWSEDGLRIGQGMECRGKEALGQQWRQFWDILERMAFFTEIGAIEVSGDTATARVYCREIIHPKGGGLWKVVGVYRDELVRREGQWLFARRDYELLMDEGTPAA
jgi:ketosteroid isomerase-like protein